MPTRAALPPLTLYNSLTRRKEPFEPRAGAPVTIYLCGLTVYDHWHLGHALQLLYFDTFRRYLERRGLTVSLVNNFTDVDDKIIHKARDEHTDWKTIADRYIAAFLQDLPRLNIRPPTVQPRATDHMDAIIALIKILVAKGAAYVVDGDVYFSVRSFSSYGQLSGQKLDEMQPGARIAVDSRLKDPADFALWKASREGEPGWPSPWGAGRPGWHIECSAMAMKYLGETIDIHAGGLDLIFPHHENERAQSEAATGKPFARVWLHNGLLRVKGAKMSKSLGNTLKVHQLLERHTAAVLRHFVLSSHYRSPAEFEEHLLADSRRALERFENLAARLARYRASIPSAAAGARAQPPPPPSAGQTAPAGSPVRGAAGATASDSAGIPGQASLPGFGGAGATAVAAGGPTVGDRTPARAALEEALVQSAQRFEQALADDFNTPSALAALFELAAEANRFLQGAETAGPDPACAALVAQSVASIDERLTLLGFPPLASGATRELSTGRAIGATLEASPPVGQGAVAAGTSGGLAPATASPTALGAGGRGSLVVPLVRMLVALRQEARARRDFAQADRIREDLLKLGVKLTDTKAGTEFVIEEKTPA